MVSEIACPVVAVKFREAHDTCRPHVEENNAQCLSKSKHPMAEWLAGMELGLLQMSSASANP
jgi:hypothetical protein